MCWDFFKFFFIPGCLVEFRPEIGNEGEGRAANNRPKQGFS